MDFIYFERKKTFLSVPIPTYNILCISNGMKMESEAKSRENNIKIRINAKFTEEIHFILFTIILFVSIKKIRYQR